MSSLTLAIRFARRELRSGWLWAGAAIALVIGLPNLIYQIARLYTSSGERNFPAM